MEQRSAKATFDFQRTVATTLQEMSSGRSPKELLLNALQLKRWNWKIAFSDTRWSEQRSGFWRGLSRYVELPDTQALREWRSSSVIVIASRTPLLLILAAKLTRRPVVLLDALQNLPARWWRAWHQGLCLRLADQVILYSQPQADEWCRKYHFLTNRVRVIPYGIDTGFYAGKMAGSAEPGGEERYVLSVGRDPERDFATLCNGAENADTRTKIVSMRYLVPEALSNRTHVDFFENVSYEELFRMYRGALAVVVPIKRDVTYMAGVRAAMEAMAMGIPVIAARTKGLESYFAEDREVVYFTPGNAKELSTKLQDLRSRPEVYQRIADAAQAKVRDKYDAGVVSRFLNDCLRDATEARTR
jgi:glycosyltransferase involved in cell wall biosynthesis